MVTARPRALALLVVTIVGLTLALVLGSNAQAATADPPAPGTEACLLKVNATDAVKAARTDVATATTAKDDAAADLTGSLLTGDALKPLQAALDEATKDLAGANTTLDTVLNAQIAALCTATSTTPSTTPETTTPETTTATPGAPTVTSVLGLIAGLRCDADFNARVGRIQDASFELARAGTSAEQLGQVSDAFNARLREIGTCTAASPTTAPTESTSITGGSSSSSSTGSQVTVPNTSAGVDTGGWA